MGSPVFEYIQQNWLEIAGFIPGLLCVVLLVRQNYLTFPIGLIYAVITVILVAREALYADVVLNLYYVVMNAYGWYYWLYAKSSRHQTFSSQSYLAIGQLNKSQWIYCLLIITVGSLFVGWFFHNFTDADLAYADSFTTVASFVAMWMSARKFIDSWWLWFVVDVVQIVLYSIKGLELYALLYAIYLGLAVWGYLTWRANLNQVEV